MSADTQLMIFNLKQLVAESEASYGAPLTLRVTSDHGTLELTIYTDDQALSQRLEIAINQAVTRLRPVTTCPQEAAAYAAAAYVYSGSTR